MNQSYTNSMKVKNNSKLLPFVYSSLKSNQLSEINFTILNLWYINFNDNYKRQSKLELIERYHIVKNINSSQQSIAEEINELFKMLDLDDSG